MSLQEFLTDIAVLFYLDPWIIQVFAVVFLTLLASFIQKLAVNKLHGRLQRTASYWDDALVDALRTPLTVFIWVVGLAFAIQIIYAETGAAIFEAIVPLRDLAVITVLAWFLVRFITRAEQNLIRQYQARGETYDLTTMDAIAKLLRISVIITAVLVALQTLGFSISGVLAFGGIGGIIVGLAAKDLLANFFGGLMVYLDRPFSVGDWIRSPDQNIEGAIEEIGWRLTRIRTMDKRPLYVPNSVFTTISVENVSRMTHRLINETIGIRYDDAGKMAAIVADVRNMLREHPDIDQKEMLIVNFNKFAPSSLDFFVFAYTRTSDRSEYHAVKEQILLRIIDIILRHGAECAFPTSTLHVPEPVLVSQAPAGDR
jgi:MscS family membrane protein